MNLQKFRWSRVYESSEEELVALLHARSIQSKRLVVEADGGPVEHTSKHTTTIWCGEGSLALRTLSTETSLQPGDAIRVDANTAYSLYPGIAGFICYVSN